MKKVLTLCFIVCACLMLQTNLSAQADPGCPELTIDANSFGFPAAICVGEALEICIDATDGSSDLSLITLTGVAVTGGPDPGFAIVPNAATGQICISTTPLSGPDPCAPYNLDISLLDANISSTDPTCTSGNVAITVIGGPAPLPDPFMTNDINSVLPLLGVAGLDPLTVTIYPSYDVVVTPPDCAGVAGSAMLMAGADVCQTVAGTAGMENVCPDVLDTDASLTYDFTASVDPLACVTGTLSDAITTDCAVACCAATASTISTTDPTRICIDGVGDPINVSIDVDGGATGTWVITDAAATILVLPPGPPFDLDGAGAGQCLIWYVNSDDAAFNPMVGDDAAAAVAASSCAFLSNPITVNRIEVTAPTISTTDPTDICADDGIDDLITPTVDAAGIGAMTAWVITDAAGTILALPPAPPFNLEGAGAGTCLIWLVNFEDPAFAPAVGDDAAAVVAAATCAVLSNSIAVTRAIGCGVCEEEITYNVGAGACDMTGATVELLDATGASLGTMALGMGGGSGSFGVQACGDYSIVINDAPVCYTNEGGDIGPRAFSIDGSGTTAQNFNVMPSNVPTVGEWGLIILGLMMSIVAIVGIRERRREEIYG